MNTTLPLSSITSSPAPAPGDAEGPHPIPGSDLAHGAGKPLTNDAI